jgi:putative FmdB family regulatory protein
MPLYDFVCKCGYIKEEFVKLDQQEPVCDKCGLRMKRAISAPAFILKGTCWAKDNYSLKKSSKKKDKKKK